MTGFLVAICCPVSQNRQPAADPNETEGKPFAPQAPQIGIRSYRLETEQHEIHGHAWTCHHLVFWFQSMFRCRICWELGQTSCKPLLAIGLGGRWSVGQLEEQIERQTSWLPCPQPARREWRLCTILYQASNGLPRAVKTWTDGRCTWYFSWQSCSYFRPCCEGLPKLSILKCGGK